MLAVKLPVDLASDASTDPDLSGQEDVVSEISSASTEEICG
jgi:hypothetical protein